MTLLSSVDDRTYIDSVRHHRRAEDFRLAIADAGSNPDVALEATYCRNWAADVLEANGATVHLAHPLGGQRVQLPAHPFHQPFRVRGR